MRFDNHVHVIAMSNGVYDVWWGSGWDNWARVNVNFQKKYIEHLRGTQMPFHIRTSLRKYLKVDHTNA